MMIEYMEEVLKNQEKWVYSNKLAEEISEKYEGISQSTVKSYLSTYREYLTTQEPFTADEKGDGTSGHLTVYWKHNENKVNGKITPHDN